MKRVGFTGTRYGMTERQKAVVWAFLRNEEPEEGHHGDCIGADQEFDEMCQDPPGPPILRVIHPPKGPGLRAWCPVHMAELRDPKPYQTRNRDIVDECEWLIACPQDFKRRTGGTWWTVRYARAQIKAGVKLQILLVVPDGESWVE